MYLISREELFVLIRFLIALLHGLFICRRHNDLPWNIRKFLKNQLREFKFDDLRNIPPWSQSAWSHTDLRRLKEGMVAAQVRKSIFLLNLTSNINSCYSLEKKYKVINFGTWFTFAAFLKHEWNRWLFNHQIFLLKFLIVF